MMQPLQLALSFLTRAPIRARSYSDNDFSDSFIFFPLAGLMIGLLVVAVAKILILLTVGHAVVAFLMLAILVVSTGGLHLDGLADTADGFFSGKGSDKALSIMKESTVGSFGVVAILLILIGKFAALWHILSIGSLWQIPPALIISRWCMVAVSFKARYPRAVGTGEKFIGKLPPANFAISTVLALGLGLIFTKLVFPLIILAGIVAFGMHKLSDSKIGGVTGDVLGATSEITELLILILIGALI